jgi:PPOX class probable F420-dependent enzyme
VSLGESEVNFIQTQRVARLATVDSQGRPHIVPICYAFDGRRFYTAIDDKPKRVSGRELKRVKNISRNPEVALLIDEYSDDWTRLAFVLIHGRAGLVSDPEERRKASELLKDRYDQYSDVDLMSAERLIIGIEPYRVHVWRASHHSHY